MSLLLRADAEQSWLHREVIPVLREVEAPATLSEEQLGAALAYLDAMWSQAAIRARATDTAHAQLRAATGGEPLAGPAGRYHAAVCALREVIATRVASFIEPDEDGDEDGYRASRPATLLATAPRAGGRAPRAA